MLTGTGVSGVQIPQIGLGTWPLTGKESTDMVAMAIDNGYRHIDTAQKYGNEDAVGKAIRQASIPRDKLFVTTKLVNAYFGDVASVRAGIEHSLSETGLEYLDLMLIHWPNPQLGNYVQTCASFGQLRTNVCLVGRTRRYRADSRLGRVQFQTRPPSGSSECGTSNSPQPNPD